MKTIHFLSFVCILMLSACGAPSSATTAATFTPFVGETETALALDLASPTPWVEGTETAMAVSVAQTESALAVESPNVLPTFPPPTSIPGVMEKPTGFSPVLYGGKLYDTTFFLLLGGVSNDAWLAPDESVERFSGEVTYSLHSMTQEYKYFLWGKTPEFSRTCKSYTIGTDAVLDEAGFVAVVDGWDVTKRLVTELSADARFYQQVVTDRLKQAGVSDPIIDHLRVLRVDIEGDGVDEVFISASHFKEETGHMTEAGDYSIILMRKVMGNDVVTLDIAGDVYHSREPELTFPFTYSLANFIDLNQDGVLEVVLDIRGWEKFGAGVFQIDGQDVIQSLMAEC